KILMAVAALCAAGLAAPSAFAQTEGPSLAVAPFAAPLALPESATVGPMINIGQTWNNCGPASVAEVLNLWGIQRTQGQVQAGLRADGNPYGMAPYAVPSYMDSLGMKALMGVGGDSQLVKALVNGGFSPIVSQWISLTNHYGHYRPIQSYDDNRGMFVS